MNEKTLPPKPTPNTDNLPKVELYLPLAFWSKIMITLDRKIHSMSDMYGFGSVGMQIVIRNGVVKDIVFSDEVRLREEKEIPRVEKSSSLTK